MTRRKTPPEVRARSRTVVAVLRARRELLGWTQDELAKRSGINQDTIRALEQGRNPNLAFFTVSAWAKSVGVPLDRLEDPEPGSAVSP
jgi:transcriptional regulator with XRE-family HTH domain